MERKYFDQVLSYVFAEHSKPGKQVELVWWDQFHKLNPKEFFEGARKLKQSETYGAPKVSDMWKAVRELRKLTLPHCLTISATEAAADNNPLSRQAEVFARRHTPDISQTQYASPAELDKAVQINSATYRKHFKEHYEQLRDRVLELISSHDTAPERAIAAVLSQSLPQSPAVRQIASSVAQKCALPGGRNGQEGT